MGIYKSEKIEQALQRDKTLRKLKKYDPKASPQLQGW